MFDRTKVVSRNYENAQKREFPRLPMHHQSFPILSVQSNAIYGHLRVEMSVKMPVLFICHSKSNCSVCLLLHELYSLGKLLNINKQTNKQTKSPTCYTPSAFAPQQCGDSQTRRKSGGEAVRPPARPPLAECHTAH